MHTIPDFQSLMLPVLSAMLDGADTPVSTIRSRVADHLDISSNDQRLAHSSGVPIYYNRIAWAISYLQRAGLIERTERGVYRLTEDGRVCQASNASLNIRLLKKYPAYEKSAFPVNSAQNLISDRSKNSTQTPLETMETTLAILSDNLAISIMERIQDNPPDFFERLVFHLLVAMGYGSDPDTGELTGAPGDGGIDGKVWNDRLGIDPIAFQAKRYDAERTVGSPDLRDFAGALDVIGLSRGIFITTSDFSQGARDYAKQTNKQIILVNGSKLTQLMIEHNVGVRSYMVKGGALECPMKKIDEDFFTLS